MNKRLNRISLALGVPGIIFNSAGLYFQMQNPHSVSAVLATGGGTFLLISGLAYYAVAKGRHWCWGFFGFLGLFGMAVLGCLRDKNKTPEEEAEKFLKPQASRLAGWSLVFGLLSMILMFFTAIPGIICGHLALHRIKKASQEGVTLGRKKMAITGLILSYLFFILWSVFLVTSIGSKR